MTEFKEALKWWNDDQNGHKEDIYPGDKIIEYGKIIRRALLIVDGLMQEPSEGMIKAVDCGYNYDCLRDPSFTRDGNSPEGAFKAMRDQLIREIDNA